MFHPPPRCSNRKLEDILSTTALAAFPLAKCRWSVSFDSMGTGASSSCFSRALVLFVAVLWPAAGIQAGWQEDVRTLRAGDAAAPPDFSARYVFGWTGFEAAEADVALRKRGDGQWTAVVRGGTTGIVRRLWKLDADYEALLAEKDWRSISSRLRETYASYRTDETTDFPPSGARSRRESTKEGSRPPRWRNFKVPGLRDIAGALLLARSQPLRDGDRISLAVFPGQWMYLVRIKVEGRETLPWKGEKHDTIRASLQIDSINKDYSLSPHKKFQRGTVWVSDDAMRIPLRVEVKVFVGHVFAELAEVSRP